MAAVSKYFKRKLFESGSYFLTCGFRGYDNHKGIDGRPFTNISKTCNVVSPVAGKVVYVENEIQGTNLSTGTQGMGNCVAVLDSHGYLHRFQHLEYHSVRVRLGEYVTRGLALGECGNTGNSTGRHLHYDISAPVPPGYEWCKPVTGKFLRSNRWYLDPLPYLQGDIYEVTYVSGLNVRTSRLGKVIGELSYGELFPIVETNSAGTWGKLPDGTWVCIKPQFCKKI